MVLKALAAGLALGLAAALPADGQTAPAPGRVSQADYEAFMGCYGNLQGGLALLARVGPASDNPAGFRAIEAGRRAVIAERFEPLREALANRIYGLDSEAGAAALNAARAPWDALAGAPHDEQVSHYKQQGPVSQTCEATLEALQAVTGIAPAAGRSDLAGSSLAGAAPAFPASKKMAAPQGRPQEE